MHILTRGIRYSHSQAHLVLFSKWFGRIFIHPPAKSFHELTEENKNGFISIAQLITDRFPSARCFCFGSRVKGNFIPDSDFDVIVTGVDLESFLELQLIRFPFKVNAFRSCSHNPENDPFLIRQIV